MTLLQGAKCLRIHDNFDHFSSQDSSVVVIKGIDGFTVFISPAPLVWSRKLFVPFSSQYSTPFASSPAVSVLSSLDNLSSFEVDGIVFSVSTISATLTLKAKPVIHSVKFNCLSSHQKTQQMLQQETTAN